MEVADGESGLAADLRREVVGQRPVVRQEQSFQSAASCISSAFEPEERLARASRPANSEPRLVLQITQDPVLLRAQFRDRPLDTVSTDPKWLLDDDIVVKGFDEPS